MRSSGAQHDPIAPQGNGGDGRRGAFAGRTVLVTGGGRGIGRAITWRFADEGADVIINYLRNESEARVTAKGVEERGSRGHLVATDVGNPDAVRAMFRCFAAEGRTIDAIIHNAAIGRFKPLLRVRPSQWDMSFRTNAQALLLLAREGLNSLIQPGGCIVALSSLGSQRYVPFYGAVGITKAAVENLVRYLAVELAPRGIRVNAVSGGMIESETLTAFPQYETMCQGILDRTPAQRLGTPCDLADVVLFLCSAQSRWIYGQTVVADGGFSLL